MSGPLSTSRRHVVVSLVMLPAVLAAPPVASEIFKCVAKNGDPLYQNFPCNIHSLDFAPLDPGTGNAVSATDASRQKLQNNAQNNSVAVAAAAAGEPRIGMTIDEVTKLWGEPQETVEDEPRSGRVSIWHYADGRVVKFNVKHRVLAVQP
jgi:hypothetical protein